MKPPQRAELVTLYSGPTPLAAMLQESLRQVGIESIIHNENAGGIPGAQFSLYARVVIARADAEQRADEVRACLASVSPVKDGDASPEVTPAEAPGGRGDEPLPHEG